MNLNIRIFLHLVRNIITLFALSVHAFVLSVHIYLSIALCRTARGDNQGSALSFVSVKDMDLLGEVEKALSESGSEYTH